MTSSDCLNSWRIGNGTEWNELRSMCYEERSSSGGKSIAISLGCFANLKKRRTKCLTGDLKMCDCDEDEEEENDQ